MRLLLGWVLRATGQTVVLGDLVVAQAPEQGLALAQQIATTSVIVAGHRVPRRA